MSDADEKSNKVIELVEDGPDGSYRPSEAEQVIVREVFYQFRLSADDRNQGFAYFDGRNLIDYINDSVIRFTTNVDTREGIEDWQARVNDPFTRNKVLAVLGKVVAVLPIASFTARGDEDIRKASILTDLYTYSEEKSDYEEFMTHFLLEAIVKGTAIGYEGMEYCERQVRDVTGAGDTMTVTPRDEKEVKLYADIVPLEEFYPSSVGLRTIKEMPHCFWRTEMAYSTFMSKWGYYAKTSEVRPAGQSVNTEDRPFYMDFISTNTIPGMVEVIRFYDVINDRYVVTANGVWINPLDNGEISPMPFNHKRLPFFDVKFDFLGNWFYGKSLPDKLKSMQDVLNVLTNMLLDQSFLTIFPPLLTNGIDSIEDDYLRPGRRTPIDTQGLPISSAFMKLDLGTPSGWHQFILDYTRKVMEEASLDSVSSGQAGVGGRTTAQEIRVAAEGVAAMLGLFGRMINYGLKQKAILRASNILQFWTDPKLPVLVGVLGSSGDTDFDKAFNLFKIDNTTLSGGKRGTSVIALYSDKGDAPTGAELQGKAKATKLRTGKNVEYLAVDAAYIRNFEFDLKLVMDQKRESTRDIEKAMQLEKVKVYMSFFPNIVDVNELAAKTAEAMGDDPTKIFKDEVFNPQSQENKMAVPPLSQNPGDNTVPNMARTGGGVDGGMQQMSQLGGAMLN